MRLRHSFSKLSASILSIALAACFSSCGSGGSSDDADTTAPTIVSITPANGEYGVDKNITKVTIVFSEPMSGGYSIGTTTYGDAPYDELKTPTWTSSTTIEIPLKTLNAGGRYDMVFNHGQYTNFKDEEGNALESVSYYFTTGL